MPIRPQLPNRISLILQAYFGDSSIVRGYIHLSSNIVLGMYMLKGGAVPIPRWILTFRFLQLFFAILIIALISFSLSVNGGGPVSSTLHHRLCFNLLLIAATFPFYTNTSIGPAGTHSCSGNCMSYCPTYTGLYNTTTFGSTPHLRPAHCPKYGRNCTSLLARRFCRPGSIPADL